MNRLTGILVKHDHYVMAVGYFNLIFREILRRTYFINTSNGHARLARRFCGAPIYTLDWPQNRYYARFKGLHVRGQCGPLGAPSPVVGFSSGTTPLCSHREGSEIMIMSLCSRFDSFSDCARATVIPATRQFPLWKIIVCDKASTPLTLYVGHM